MCVLYLRVNHDVQVSHDVCVLCVGASVKMCVFCCLRLSHDVCVLYRRINHDVRVLLSAIESRCVCVLCRRVNHDVRVLLCAIESRCVGVFCIGVLIMMCVFYFVGKGKSVRQSSRSSVNTGVNH